MKTVVVALTLTLAVTARAEHQVPPQPPPFLSRGLEHYRAGRYAEAIEEFKRALQLAPRPELYYALAQAERQLGRCVEAVAHYQAFLKSKPSPLQAESARQNIERCSITVGEAPQPAEPPPATPPPAPPEPPPPPRPSAARDPAGHVLWVSGVALGIAGGALLGVAERNVRAAADARRYDEFILAYDPAQGAESQRIAGAVLLAAGGVAVVAGIVRFGVVAKRAARDR
jgi:tetratricopeptide (TPR) repeat protein